MLFSADRYTWLAFVPLLTHAHQPVYRLLSPSKAHSQHFSGNFATIVRYPKPSSRSVSFRALSSYDILPITKVVGLWNTWNTENFVDMLHVNIKTLRALITSLQRFYLLLSYFNNKFNFFVPLWNSFLKLRFCQFDMSSRPKYSTKPNKWAKFGAKIFRHFWDRAYSNFRVGIFCLTMYTHTRIVVTGDYLLSINLMSFSRQKQ